MEETQLSKQSLRVVVCHQSPMHVWDITSTVMQSLCTECTQPRAQTLPAKGVGESLGTRLHSVYMTCMVIYCIIFLICEKATCISIVWTPCIPLTRSSCMALVPSKFIFAIIMAKPTSGLEGLYLVLFPGYFFVCCEKKFGNETMPCVSMPPPTCKVHGSVQCSTL